MSHPVTAGPSRLHALQVQHRHTEDLAGFPDPLIEREFLSWVRAARAQLRAGILCVPLVVLTLAPLFGTALLDGRHDEYGKALQLLRIMEWGVGVPACLLSIWWLRRDRLRAVGHVLFLFSGALLFVILAAVRWITAQHGGALSAELVMLIPLTYGALGGISRRHMIPAILTAAATLMLGDALIQSGASWARATLGTLTTTALALVCAHLADSVARRAWLDSNIVALAAMTDAVTGLPNRAWFNRDADLLLRRVRREPKPIAVYLIDLDHFKLLNDTYGHHAGDDALSAVGAMLNRYFARRPYDLVGRYGGEELVVILPTVSADNCDRFAAELVLRVSQLGIPNAKSATGLLTASVGCWQGEISPQDSLETLLERADKALYRAKAAGRNRFCVHGRDEGTG